MLLKYSLKNFPFFSKFSGNGKFILFHFPFFNFLNFPEMHKTSSKLLLIPRFEFIYFLFSRKLLFYDLKLFQNFCTTLILLSQFLFRIETTLIFRCFNFINFHLATASTALLPNQMNVWWTLSLKTFSKLKLWNKGAKETSRNELS